MRPRALFILSALLAFATVSSGCKRKNIEDTGDGGLSAMRPSEKSVPADHVAKGTLIPGTQKVYALPVPIGFRVTGHVATYTTLMGNAPAPAVVAYITERVRDGTVRERGNETTWKGVRLPDDPGRYLDITVTATDGNTMVTILDVTPVPAPPPLPQAAAWKQYGLDSNGRVLDRNHAE